MGNDVVRAMDAMVQQHCELWSVLWREICTDCGALDLEGTVEIVMFVAQELVASVLLSAVIQRMWVRGEI